MAYPNDLRRSSNLMRAHERTPLAPKHDASARRPLLLALAAGVLMVGGSAAGYRAILVGGADSAPPEMSAADWTDFKGAYGKRYETAELEAAARSNFEDRLATMAEANRANGAAVFGVTEHADRPAGANARARGRRPRVQGAVTEPSARRVALDEADLAAVRGAAKDWRADSRGVVGAVKNQGQCGSCWAFAATEQIEAQLVLAGAPQVELSAQQVASCATEEEGCCDGCGGGDVAAAYEYIAGAEGLAPEAFWPYAQSLTPDSQCLGLECTESCDRDVSQLPADYEFVGPYAKVMKYGYATEPCEVGACENQNVVELAARVLESPVAVCLNAGSFDDYVGGVISEAACGGYSAMDVDHCVQLVGVNTTAEQPHWIIRNSWSPSWGENGYARLAYTETTNPCGIANEATVVRVREGRGL